jgi:hypothetical protein
LNTVRNTIPILYNGGAYGTYLEWVLTTLTTDVDIVAPFTQVGNSHQFNGNQLLNMDGWRRYIDSAQPAEFVRLHPKTKKEESLSDNLNSILSTVDRMIYLYPDKNSALLVINNYYSKVWTDWWMHQLNHEIDQEKIYQNWPVDKSTPIEDIPNWIKREFLSFYLVPAWLDQVEWYHLDRWQNSKCITLTVQDLLYNFESSILQIQEFCNLTFTKDPKEMLLYHTQMLQLQKYSNQDQVCQQIIQSVVDDYEIEWSELPLASQSWVQWQLRNLNFEIQCDGLDKFPTTSVQLKKLLYRTT